MNEYLRIWKLAGTLTIALLGGMSAQSLDYFWTNNGGDNNYLNPSNWSTNGVTSGLPAGNQIAVIDFAGADRAILSSGSPANIAGIRIGYDGSNGEFSQSGGTLSVTANSSTASRIGRDGELGTWTMTGGTANVNALQVGLANGTGRFNLHGGGLIIARGVSDYSLISGTGGFGQFEISNGSLATRIGVKVGIHGVFSVLGSGATSIRIGSQGALDGRWVQELGSTLHVGIDDTAQGVTPIFVDETDSNPLESWNGDVSFEPGSWLDVDFLGANNFGTFTVMEWDGSLITNALEFAAGVDTNVWSFQVNELSKELTVTATPPPTGRTAVTVSNIAQLQLYADADLHDVTLVPGTYWLTGPPIRPAPYPEYPIFLDLSGYKSTYTFTGVHIKVDTQELKGYGREFGHDSGARILQVSGYGVEVDGLTLSMEKLAYDGTDAYGDPREFTSDFSCQVVRVIGSKTTVKNCNITTGGSYPYGYGDAFGKGTRPNTGGVTDAAFISHNKQSGFLITRGATDVTVDNVTLNMRSFGHGFFMQQGARDIVFKDCSVIGDTMANSDAIIAHPEYQAWGFATYKEPIPPNINISKHEGAYRVYNNDDYLSNGYPRYIENITITNCLAERMRNGVACGGAAGYLRVFETEVTECEMGFAPHGKGTENTFLRCKGDARNGPLVYFQRSGDNVVMEVELTGTNAPQGTWPIALIGGNNNRVTLTSTASPGTYPSDAYVNVSQKWREWRHRPSGDIDEVSTGNYADYTTASIISNLTDQILVLGPNATGNTGCVSTGGVINKGSGNTYTGTTLAPAPIIVQDTWSSPPNSTNVPWAQTNSSGELILPTPPYTVFSGTHLVDDALSLGGIRADDGTVVSNGGTLEIAGGFASQGEAVTLSGGGVSGKGALFSEGAIVNSTRLNTTSGAITLTASSSIGVGAAGNQFLIGPIGGTANLSKAGPGRLVMEGGPNTFSGILTVVAGEIFARANKAISDLTLLSGGTFAQNADLALNQGAEDSTLLYGTLDLNGRGIGDTNSLSANIGVLTGRSSGLVTSTATGAVQTLNINSTTSDSNFDGTIQGPVAVAKNGAGTTLTLASTNTYTGPTTVNAGTLLVNSSLPAASAVTVNSGGTLGGSGLVFGLVTLNSGASVAPGNSVGRLVTGPQTWHGGTFLNLEVDNTNGPAGTGWDSLLVNGTLTLDSSVTPGTPLQINLSAPPLPFDNSQRHSWLIVDAAGIAGAFSPDKVVVDASAFAANNPLGNGQFSVSQIGNDLHLDFTPVVYTALELWRFDHFGCVTNVGIGADDADPDTDWRKNIVEYATGTDPKVFDAGSAATAGTTLDGTRLTITFDRIADPVLVYSVEVDNDITSATWTNIWSSTGASNTVGPIIVPDTGLISNHGQRFLQLKVTY